MTSNPSMLPYPSFDASDPKNIFIYRMKVQAHHYAQYQQSIIFLCNVYNDLVKNMATLGEMTEPDNPALEAFGPELVADVEYLLSPMTKAYWEARKREEVESLEMTVRKGQERLSALIEREAATRKIVNEFKEASTKAVEESRLMDCV